ncbi:MAG: hypothetical protein RL761_1214 [Pseudomonadota bacterium]|jgi:hypothetical protein
MAASSMCNRWKLRATSVALFFLCTGLGLNTALAQEAVYRCGNEYTNDAARAKSEKCKLLESGAIVTVPSHKRTMDVQKPAANQNLNKRPAATPATSEQRAQQQKRDSDSQLIIQSELKKTESQLLDLRKQFDQIPATASGADLEKKANLKQQINRHEADIVSLKRELKR